MKTSTYFRLAVLALTPHIALACKPVAGLQPPTDEEKLRGTDLAVIGTVTGKKEAPALQNETGHAHPFLITVDVQKWLKGSGTHSLEFVDTTGTDCDESHIALQADPRATQWKIYARQQQGRLVISTAHRLP